MCTVNIKAVSLEDLKRSLQDVSYCEMLIEPHVAVSSSLNLAEFCCPN